MIIIITFAILIILFLISLTLKIKIEIKNLNLILPSKEKINKESKLTLNIYILKKIKISEINLKKVKMDNEKIKEKMDNFRDNIKDGLNKNIIKYIKNINYKIEKLDLNVFIGLEDASTTAISVGIISSLIVLAIKNKIKNPEIARFQVLPVYNENFLKVELNGIFTFNIVNIKNIIKFLMKGRVNKNVKPSYRRSYAYNNE